MARKKQLKLDEIKVLPNVFSADDEGVSEKIKKFFNNSNKFTIELGCGNGDYTTNLAAQYPAKNFIGVDRKGNRIWTGSKNSLQAEFKNAAFLVTAIERIDKIFDKNSVEEIWITFPDPYPRRSSMHKRLVHPLFLELYEKVIAPGARINLKTDDDTLYEYAIQIVAENNYKLHKSTSNLYDGTELTFEESIQTKYEKNHLKEGKTIKYICFSIS
jgi:tRNA (guanine-N7-)-methyltransferase